MKKPKIFTTTERLTALSDGVFAFAITLLVLAIHVPQASELTHSSLRQALQNQWPTYLGFAVSFMVIGRVWMNHHATFSYIKRVNYALLLLNLFLLMTIVFMPFATYVLALYFSSPEYQQTAVILYSGTFAVSGVVYNLLWWYASTHNLVDKQEQEEFQSHGKRYLYGMIFYFLAFFLAFFNATLSLGLSIVLAVSYLFLLLLS